MKTLRFIPLFIGVVAAGFAGEHVFPLSAESLGAWSLTGAETLAGKKSGLELSAGAQLARRFSGSSVSVRLVTAAPFGAQSADWPVLEIGGAALIFQERNGEGKLALALDELPPVVLPFTLELDSTGHSAEPLVVDFKREGAVVTVTLDGQTAQMISSAPLASTQEVVASAGASSAWSWESFLVRVTTADAADVSASSRPPENSSKEESFSTAAKTPSGRSTAAQAGDSAAPNAVPSPAGKTAQTPPTPRGLEIFTPAAVRHGRADALRAASAPTQP